MHQNMYCHLVQENQSNNNFHIFRNKNFIMLSNKFIKRIFFAFNLFYIWWLVVVKAKQNNNNGTLTTPKNNNYIYFQTSMCLWHTNIYIKKNQN
jgi:hypothetical protein